MNSFQNIIKELGGGLLLSYPQVFFSKSYIFSLFLIVITFIFPTLGIGGATCALSALIFAKILGLSSNKIKTGYYGYNALLVGLGLSAHYEWSIFLLTLIVFASFLTLLIHVYLEGILSKYRLPILSFPFLFTLWIIELAARNFNFLNISDRGIFLLNNLFAFSGIKAVQLYDSFNNLWLPNIVKYFFISLGSIFFQDNAFAGLFIFIGLLIFSRIAASLSVLGFITAWGFMQLMGIDTLQMSTYYVGFNFILTAIALGGFYIVPSLFSYIWIIVLSPIVVLITIGFTNFLSGWQLSVYSLPFNLIIIMFLYILYFRSNPRKKLIETVIQEFMPEKNLYSYLNFKKRFGKSFQKNQILLPFWGEWTVSQGYNGSITHKDQYKHALDFVITYNNKTYKGIGNQLEDYYCYNKLVISPGYGTVIKVIDHIEDNSIGDVNTINNWGNTIVIKHNEYLYSQLSHLKAGSIRVHEGEFVKLGQPIAQVGNSGRSPEPHLHFQLQPFPYVGSYTIEYPIARYLLKINSDKELKILSIPQENDVVENPTKNQLLSKAFHFIPGQQFDVIQTINNKTITYRWEVLTDSLNNSYLYCHTTNSYAYFYNDGLSFYFNSFAGNKKSPLYMFYLSSYHVEFSTIKNYVVNDEFPLHHIFKFTHLFIHDFVAPFFQFIKASYMLNINHVHNQINEIQLNSIIQFQILNKKINSINSHIFIDKNGIQAIAFKQKNKKSYIKIVNIGLYE